MKAMPYYLALGLTITVVMAGCRGASVNLPAPRLPNNAMNLTFYGNDQYELEVHLGMKEKVRVLGSYAVEKGGVFVLDDEYKNLPGPFKLNANRYMPLTWGRFHYWIAENDVIQFCNEINSCDPDPHRFLIWSYGRVVNLGFAPLRIRPELPFRFWGYLLTSPIHGRITGWDSENIASLDVGQKVGLKVGMIVWAKGLEKALKVISVKDHQALAKYDAGPLTNSDFLELGPSIEVSTRRWEWDRVE